MNHQPRFDTVRTIIETAQQAHAFAAAAIEVGSVDGSVWRETFGTLTYDDDAPLTALNTVFDLASLTKVIATTTLVMRLTEAGALSLNDPVSRWMPDWRGDDRADVTIEDLLAHASGLTTWLPLYRDHVSRREFEAAIASAPLEYAPRSRSVYSDLGFMLLGFITEQVTHVPLDAQFADVAQIWESSAAGGDDRSPIGFKPPARWRSRTAPTEVDPWRGRLLVGEVHDENAWALGGVAGHAGLFGSVAAVGRFARAMLALRVADRTALPLVSPDTVQRFTRPTAIPESSRALGWDMMRPTSSCGVRMSTDAFGHTGFTGTSLWIDPVSRVYVVFLTNRVHPSRANDAIQQVRPAVHNAVLEAV